MAPSERLEEWLALLGQRGARLSKLDSCIAGNVVRELNEVGFEDALKDFDSRVRRALAMSGTPDAELETALRPPPHPPPAPPWRPRASRDALPL